MTNAREEAIKRVFSILVERVVEPCSERAVAKTKAEYNLSCYQPDWHALYIESRDSLSRLMREQLESMTDEGLKALLAEAERKKQ